MFDCLDAWSFLVEGDENSYLPNCQTNFAFVLQELSLMFWHIYPKHNSLPLGVIRAPISSHERASSLISSYQELILSTKFEHKFMLHSFKSTLIGWNLPKLTAGNCQPFWMLKNNVTWFYTENIFIGLSSCLDQGDSPNEHKWPILLGDDHNWRPDKTRCSSLSFDNAVDCAIQR